jgi:hypothetical protein
MPSLGRCKYATLPAFLLLCFAPIAVLENERFSFVRPTRLDTNTKKHEKSSTTNATIEQKHQSLLEIGIFAFEAFIFIIIMSTTHR